MSRALSEFKVKHVQGLYSFNHYEAADGAFVQISHRGDTFVYQEGNGIRFTFDTFAALKEYLAKD